MQPADGFGVPCTEVYVWPRVREERKRRVTHDRLAPSHLRVLQALLVGYSGVCNVNYKTLARQAGEDALRIFEVNTRVGGDLANDAARADAAAFFETLDRVGTLLPSSCDAEVPAAEPADGRARIPPHTPCVELRRERDSAS